MHTILQNQKATLPPVSQYIKRYNVDFAVKQLDHDLVKAVIGPRRVGKSVLGLEILAGKPFGYVNFDDPDILHQFTNFNELTKAIEDVYGTTPFLYFDEIQNLPQWELYVNSLHRAGKNIVLTGSNANLLSSELATHLTGRVVEIMLWPFSWQEVQAIKPDLTMEDFLLGGNYPEVIIKEVEPELYYTSLFQTSVVKDIITRYGLRNPLDLERLAQYLLSTLTNLYSYQSIAHKLNMTVPTVSRYINYLSESLLFYELPRFSQKSAEIIRSNKKLYTVDYAFSRFVGTNAAKNIGFAYENAVFVELCRSGLVPGKNLFYAENNSQEIDFVVSHELNRQTYIQVSYNMQDTKTFEREVKAFAGLEGEKIMVTQYPPAGTVSDDIHVISYAELVRFFE